MDLSKLRPGLRGYLVDPETGRRARFYLCDPGKNTLCDHAMCRYPREKEDDAEIGFCVSTPIRAFRRTGTGPFFFRLNSRGQYVQEWAEEGWDHDEE